MIVPLQNNFTKNQFRDHNRNLWRAFFGGTSDNSFDEETQTGITVGYSITDDEEMTPEIENWQNVMVRMTGLSFGISGMNWEIQEEEKNHFRWLKK